ncbi:PTS system beta-glucoside-specific IIA component (Glc family) /PTS system beta-glucoside-specific IIB component (Glc family) /PTS system beta-glucoside-specific IIC component (Glc family) [Cricetibacter osteomyelitidis]|uniref:PTS system beta-glucoside-specific IIA component (Glc family) /PTS system beta-glucoside-specific IIB component (Glc family) /PTS system beta-glucoside-specific IIC component (Glc family) n=1 Tax=Cricetibacter osteomyelitidis TaxID=1521931 RepID=A0A4R2SPR8_9PAST|nr:beta-glucoside-specific PTS transporter subunit IIABC [Cricetibacter osteomyelitidis]TCP90094.1 PTS system beta-glucoside-specific IIA component (Glc family) /PTS system beta-glucoside-specific IIB component (Glc family) /PTS system beta-glucoside-specific IIC component (Glc family) [Cricetibacter osteomyelitidis]
MNYDNFAKEIINFVGSEKNIKSVVHCSTRLRFVLFNDNNVNEQAIKQHSHILSTVKKGGQFQLVIGNNVDKVYNAIMQQANLSEKKETSDKDASKQSIVNKALSIITGSIAPVIPILAGAGMGKVLLVILNMMGILEKSSQTYYILNFIFDTGFYFMPVFIGFSAAKMFNCNQYLAAFVCLAMLNPNWDSLVKAGNPVCFLEIPIALVKYSSQLIPALLTVWLMSYIEKIIYRIVPEMVKVFLAPLLVIIIVTPIALIAIGPIASFLAQMVADSVMLMQEHIGFIALPILVAIYPWLVSIGMHKALSPITIMLVEQKGFDPIIRVIALCSNMSQAAAALAVSIKSKNKEFKQLAFSAGITALLGGITEPAMYGINLRLKRPIYACMVGGATAGLFAGLVKLKAFVYATPGILSLPMWISDNDNQLINAIITLIIASIVTFISTFIIGFDDPIPEGTTTSPSKKVNINNTKSDDHAIIDITSPIQGEIIPLTDIDDETFASGILGTGVAIIPREGIVRAPDSATIYSTFSSGHAIGLKLDSGVEMLIHIGIDTVKLEGKYFKTLVAKGQSVAAGDTLIEFDLEALKQIDVDITTAIIIANSDDYLEKIVTPETETSPNTTLLTLIK